MDNHRLIANFSMEIALRPVIQTSIPQVYNMNNPLKQWRHCHLDHPDRS